MTFFKDLSLIQPILKAIEEEGYEKPTPIQAKAIPLVLKGKDLLGCAQTGTGKTAAFAIPILQELYQNKPADRKKRIRSLIVTPTRELAIQISESFTAYGRHCGLSNAVIFGGVGVTPQIQQLRQGVDILIATPGRLLDLVGQGEVSLGQLEIFVLDEADRMLDMGFINDVRKIVKLLPAKRQSLFFSATMPDEIAKLANTILVDPAKVEVTPVSSTAETIQQFLYYVEKDNKNNLLMHVLKNQDIKNVLVFTRTKHGADKVVKWLLKNDVTAEAIHGNKAQNARQRALNNFKAKTTRVLVATDIAARGIDVDDLQYVINYEIPNISETYVHRIGRTGRAGANGTAYSFCDATEILFIADIEKLISKKIHVVTENPFEMKHRKPQKMVKEQREPRELPNKSNNPAKKIAETGPKLIAKNQNEQSNNQPKKKKHHQDRPQSFSADKKEPSNDRFTQSSKRPTQSEFNGRDSKFVAPQNKTGNGTNKPFDQSNNVKRNENVQRPNPDKNSNNHRNLTSNNQQSFDKGIGKNIHSSETVDALKTSHRNDGSTVELNMGYVKRPNVISKPKAENASSGSPKWQDEL